MRDDDDDDSIVEWKETYGRGKEGEEENVATVVSPSYMGRSRRFFDTQYVISKDGEQLMIGD